MPTTNPSILSYTKLGHRPWWIRQLLKPVGWPLATACALASLLMLHGGSVPGGYLGEIGMAGLFYVGAVAYWALRLIVRAILVRAANDPSLRHWRNAWRWLVSPAIALATVLLLRMDVPLALRFRLGHAEMERAAHVILTAPPPYADQWIGPYRAEHIEAIPGGMRFVIRGVGMPGGEQGFAYCTGMPETADEWTYTQYDGNWYLAWHGRD